MKPDGRILVVGAGVNGSVCAGALHRAGYDVTVLARGKRLEELQDGGIEIADPLKGTRTVPQVPVVDRLASEDIYEYVLVVVLKNQVRDLRPFSLKTSRSRLCSWLIPRRALRSGLRRSARNALCWALPSPGARARVA